MLVKHTWLDAINAWKLARVGVELPDFRKLETPGIRKSGFPDIRIFGDSEVRECEDPDFRIPENAHCRKSTVRTSGKPENPDVRMLRFSGFSC